MAQRIARASTTVGLLLLAGGIWGVEPAAAKYRYSRYATGQGGGFFVQLEAGLVNPRGTDAVLATQESIRDFGGGTNTLMPVLPTWDDDAAGRLTLGYAWANGTKLSASYWSFDTDQSARGVGPSSGVLHFAVGPPIFTGGQYVGAQASPGSYDLTTEIDATTADLAWGREQELSESFAIEWSLGLRHASYEETTSGFYDERATSDPLFGQDSFAAAKRNEGEMFGARARVRASYRVGQRISLHAALGFSFLDGELTADSQLTPTGTSNSTTIPAARATVFDDGRSGTIRDLDVFAAWHSAGDAFRVLLGWEQGVWDEIARDLVRNFPGTSAPLAERDSVTFSGYKLGLYFRF